MKALIFDVDGTLWDSTEVVAQAWNAALEEYTDWDLRVNGELLKKHFGKPMSEIAKAVFPDCSDEERDHVSEKCMDNQNPWLLKYKPALYDGVTETLKELYKQYNLFIVSNCHSGYIETLMDISGIREYITDFTCPPYTGKYKADNIRLIMERNGIEDAMYVGDTIMDYNACSRAGVPFIFCRYGFGDVPEEKCSYIINSFSELLGIKY
ncbi:MAG: HAD family hydrolase [Lachnospiraceae bacterium]|nr:HAD family hydrolase [Lachnospiraceae bacterium]